MENSINWLLTLSNGEYVIKVALKTSYDKLPGDAGKYPLEPENKATVMKLLPEHVRSFGTIVDVEEIFDVLTTNGS